MSTLPPLLITSAVRPADGSVVLSSDDLRIRYTLDALDRWLQLAPKLKIVICDGSGFDFSPLLQTRYPNRDIEALSFLNDQTRVSATGKGYGEGEIMAYALQHSQTLAASRCFAKCTSKLWVQNFDSIMRHWNGRMLFQAKISNILKRKPLVFRHIDTRFYVIDRDMYQHHFSDAYRHVNDVADHSLEHCFREVIERQHMTQFLSPVPFHVYGVSGSTGDFFQMSLGSCLSESVKLAEIGRAHV